jgi:hypothetical protein
VVDRSEFPSQPVGNGLESGLLRPPLLRKLTMALHYVPAQVMRSEFVAVEFQRFDCEVWTQLGDIEQPIQTAGSEQPLALILGSRHQKTVRLCAVVAAVKQHQKAQEGAVQIVASGQVNDEDPTFLFLLKKVACEFLNRGTLAERSASLNPYYAA